MKINAVTAHVRINSRIFRRFALYDTFLLRRRFVSPCIFAAIFLAFSLVAFLSGREQSALLGGVLLAVGLFMPLTYVASFLLQVHDQSARLGLKALRPAYTLNMGETELRVINDMKQEDEAHFPWTSMHGVWRTGHAYYLYVSPSRAFILPDGQCSLSPADLWDFLSARIGAGKMHGKKP